MTDGVTIGQVISLLEEEFPDVTVSKIRFLETKGLISPGRTESGYRAFSDDDLSRIRYILQQQRDHFLPLKVIKSNLAAWERGEELAGDEGPSGAPAGTYFASTPLAMTVAELARSAGVTPAQVEALVEHHVITSTAQRGGQPLFDEEALAVVRAAKRLLASGLDPRHVRQVRLGAERSLDLLDNLTKPLLVHGTEQSRQQAADTLAECGQAITELQEAVLRGELRRLLKYE